MTCAWFACWTHLYRCMMYIWVNVSWWTCRCHHIPASQAEDVRFVIDGTGVQEMQAGSRYSTFAHGSDLLLLLTYVHHIFCMQIWVRHTLKQKLLVAWSGLQTFARWVQLFYPRSTWTCPARKPKKQRRLNFAEIAQHCRVGASEAHLSLTWIPIINPQTERWLVWNLLKKCQNESESRSHECVLWTVAFL